MRSILLAAAVATLPLAAAAQSDSSSMSDMLTQIEQNAQNTLEQYNVEADVRELTLNQLVQITDVSLSDDEGIDNAEQELQQIVDGDM